MTDQEMCEVFAKNLNRMLAEKGMKKADLRRILGVGAATVSDWTHGRNIPRTPILSKMTTIFNCSLKELLQDKKEDPIQEDEVNAKKKAVHEFVDGLTDQECERLLVALSALFPSKQ